MINATRQQLIELLADGEFHSGEVLADKLALSRAAIHNNIQALAELGLEIFSVKGKGYRLQRPLSLLNAATVNAGRSEPLHLFWQLGSTNDFINQRRALCVSGESCFAEMQTAGRGRRGRPWQSPMASHLYLSYFYRLEQGMAAAAGLSLAVGVMVAEELAQLGYAGIGLKWPNDLYLHNRKLGGILVELNGQFGEAAELTIGIGLNVAMPASTAAQIDQAWSDLQSQQEQLINRSELANALLRKLDDGMAEFAANGLTSFVAPWRQLDCFKQQPVQLLMGERVLRGNACGIDGSGNLLLEIDGQQRAFAAGEISLRPA